MTGKQMSPASPMSSEQAVLYLRAQEDQLQLLHDSYLDADLEGAGRRFLASEEFKELLRIVGTRVKDGVVVDVGAGTGIASYAFAQSGAHRVVAVEPDPSDVVGAGAIRTLTEGLYVDVLADRGEKIRLPSEVADVVYARQVLHHVRDLGSLLGECARVLKPGGLFIAAREHVVSDEAQRQVFLEGHVFHQLTQAEDAYELSRYTGAIRSAGLELIEVLGPLDSVINAYPGLTLVELEELPGKRLRQKLGALGIVVSKIPVASRWMRKRVARGAEETPGRLYTFIALKPGA